MVLPDGRTSFQALQNASARAAGTTLAYFVFDLLRARRRRSHRAAPARAQGAVGAPAGACRRRFATRPRRRRRQARAGGGLQGGAEGIVSKRADQPYRAGAARRWLKTKCMLRQEFVISGFTEPRGSRSGLGALLVGDLRAAGALRFAGKVGTGFTPAVGAALRRGSTRSSGRRAPFATPPRGAAGATPTGSSPTGRRGGVHRMDEDGKIRHPSFQGLREDKDPRTVRRERPANHGSHR